MRPHTKAREPGLRVQLGYVSLEKSTCELEAGTAGRLPADTDRRTHISGQCRLSDGCATSPVSLVHMTTVILRYYTPSLPHNTELVNVGEMLAVLLAETLGKTARFRH